MQAEACILAVANSLRDGEPLRQSFLSARPVAQTLAASEGLQATLRFDFLVNYHGGGGVDIDEDDAGP